MTELTVFSTHAAYDVLAEVGPRFERDTGNKLTFRYDPAKAVRRQVEEGAVFDVAIITRPVFDALAEKGHILPETRADLGRSGLGVSVREGRAQARHFDGRRLQARAARRQIGGALDRRHQRHVFRAAAR